jgi:hypothetical protein
MYIHTVLVLRTRQLKLLPRTEGNWQHLVDVGTLRLEAPSKDVIDGELAD